MSKGLNEAAIAWFMLCVVPQKQHAGVTGLGCNMGMGKPTVFPKPVRQVQVWCWILTHHCTLCTHPAVLWVLMGLLLSLLFLF